MPADALNEPYTSASRGVELGRDVVHFLQRRFQQRPGHELLRVGQRLVGRPLLAVDHGLAPRLQDIGEQILGQLGAKRVAGLLPDDRGILVGVDAEVLLQGRERALLVVAEEHDAARDGADEFLGGVGILVDEALHGPERAAGALDVVAGAQQHLHAGAHHLRHMRHRDQRRLDVAIDHGGDPLVLARERDHLVVFADRHLEGAQHDRGALVVVGGAGAAVADGLAPQILRLVDARTRRDHPMRLERLADHVADFGAAQRRLGAAGRDRDEVDAAGQAGGHQRPALQRHEARIEALGFEEALVHRDVAWDVKAAAADDLADGDLGLRLRARREQRRGGDQARQQQPHPHGSLLRPGMVPALHY